MIRVAICAPTPALRLGLRALLLAPGEDGAAATQVVGEASSPRLLPAALEADVLVVAGEQARPGLAEWFEGGAAAAVLFLVDADGGSNLPPGGLRAASGAVGILPLDAGEDELHAAVAALAQGLSVGAPALLELLWGRRPPARAQLAAAEGDLPPAEALTGRELDVLQLLAQGLANKQIAARLGISEHTVKFHTSAVYAKLGVASRTEAVRRGIQLGLVVV
jgi:DNA-binding NarL/FixJ family response regulator